MDAIVQPRRKNFNKYRSPLFSHSGHEYRIIDKFSKVKNKAIIPKKKLVGGGVTPTSFAKEERKV